MRDAAPRNGGPNLKVGASLRHSPLRGLKALLRRAACADAACAAYAAPRSGAFSGLWGRCAAGWLRPSGWGLAAALIVAPRAAHAADPPPAPSETIQIAVRSAGWAMPFGRLSQSGSPVRAAIRGAFPLLLDLGARVFPRLFVGAYLGFHPGLVGDAYHTACSSSVSCDANNVRIGLQAQFYLFPSSRFNPWLGLGFGSEATTITIESRASDSGDTPGGTGSFQGPEYLHAALGLDVRSTEVLGFGPFAALTLGRYEAYTARNTLGTNKTVAIEHPALHQWVMVGVRGVLFP